MSVKVSIDDSAEGGLTQFLELRTVIPCAAKDIVNGLDT